MEEALSSVDSKKRRPSWRRSYQPASYRRETAPRKNLLKAQPPQVSVATGEVKKPLALHQG